MPATQIHFDALFSNVALFDGHGNAPLRRDVAIAGDRIVEITSANTLKDLAPATLHFDGTHLALAPGFIDVHTHDDTNVVREPDCFAKLSQGITTVIVGNCGISASPAVLTQSPPDPMNLLGEQVDFCYPSFADYVKAVERAAPAVNVAALVGHTTLRNNVMEDLTCAANAQQIAKMQTQLTQAMQEGALGLSSGLAYSSAFAASAYEVIELAKVLRRFGGIYTTHMRSEFAEIIQAMEEAFTTGQAAQVPVVLSHLKCAGAGNWGRSEEVLARLERAALEQEVACDCYPYAASSSTLDLKQVTDEFDIFITWSESLPECAGRTLKQIQTMLSKRQGQQLSLMETARALQPAGAVYHCMDDADVRTFLKSKHTMIGSDGLPNDPHPHPRLWGAFPRVLGHYAREEQLFSLTEAVHKMTGLSATRFGLVDRGVIRVGAYADLVLFDPDRIEDKATFENPKQPAAGIEAVFVNGVLSYQAGNKPSQQRAGRFLTRATAGKRQ